MLNNSNYSKETATRIPMNTVEIFRAGEPYWYSHSPYIAMFNGRLVAMFMVNKLGEAQGGQDVLLSYSDDFLTWTKPVKIPVDDSFRENDMLIAPGGFFVHDDTLNIYFRHYGWIKSNSFRVESDNYSHPITKMYCITTKDCINFSEAIDMNLDVSMMDPPKKCSLGNIVATGHFSYLYTDDPAGIHGFIKSGYLPKEVYDEYPDHSQSLYRVGKYVGLDVHLMEAQAMDLGNGHMRMIMRSRDNRNFVQLENELYTKEVGDGLYASDSTDGINWSPVYRTEFTNNDSKISCGKFSDGRYYIISNPDRLGLRLPLVLSISEDGDNFDKHYIIREDFNNIRKMGKWKQYGAQYAHTIEDDGWLYIIYSICKEDVYISRISLKDLK